MFLDSVNNLPGIFCISAAVVEDFGTFDNQGPAGASGTAKALSLTYHVSTEVGGD